MFSRRSAFRATAWKRLPLSCSYCSTTQNELCLPVVICNTSATCQFPTPSIVCAARCTLLLLPSTCRCLRPCASLRPQRCSYRMPPTAPNGRHFFAPTCPVTCFPTALFLVSIPAPTFNSPHIVFRRVARCPLHVSSLTNALSNFSESVSMLLIFCCSPKSSSS